MPSSKFVASFEYTDAEMLALLRECLARITVAGQEYEVAGRKFRAADLDQVERLIRYYESRVTAAASGLVQNDVILVRNP